MIAFASANRSNHSYERIDVGIEGVQRGHVELGPGRQRRQPGGVVGGPVVRHDAKDAGVGNRRLWRGAGAGAGVSDEASCCSRASSGCWALATHGKPSSGITKSP